MALYLLIGIIIGAAYLIIRLNTKKRNISIGDIQMIVCSKCGHKNAGGKFCVKCGTDLSFREPLNILEINKAGSAVSSEQLLLIAICILFVSTIFQFIRLITAEDPFTIEPKYVQIVLNIIAAFAPLLVALAIKKRSMKIIGIILSSAIAFAVLYSSVESLSRINEFFK